MSKTVIKKKVSEEIIIETDKKDVKKNRKVLNKDKMKKIRNCLLIVIGLVIFFVVGLNWPVNEDTLNGKYDVLMSIKDYGEIELELDADVAPITVTNFIKLVSDGFYDGLTFHRVIDGFMIQGGDPDGDGTGGSSETIKGEFSSNGVTNNLSHERGVISMARSNDMNSASSQFFIMHEDNTNLDGNYAAFGKVTSGIEVVDKIVEAVSEYGDDNGMLPTENQPVIEYIKVIE